MADTIFLTGGTGFLGRHLVPLLCRAGYAVRVLTRYPDQNAWLSRLPRVTLVRGDLRSASLESYLDGCDYVIHAGGVFRFWGEDAEFRAVNVAGTNRLLDAVIASRINRFIHISTIAVIGKPDPEKTIDEAYPPRPVDAYQRSKLESECLALAAAKDDGLQVIVLRPGAYYGPLGHYAFNRLFFTDPMRGIIMQVNRGRYIIFPAYIGDVARGVLQAMHRGRPGEIYNICGDWISHKDAFDIICQEAGLSWPRIQIPGWLGVAAAHALEAISSVTKREPFWPLNLRSYVYNYWRVSNEKARRELGFAPTDFRTGVRRTIDWYRAGRPNWLPELICPVATGMSVEQEAQQ